MVRPKWIYRPSISIGFCVFLALIEAFIFGVLPARVLWLVGDHYPFISLVLSVALFCFLGVVLISVRTTEVSVLHNRWLKGDLEEEIGFSVGTMVAFILAFAVLCRSLDGVSSSQFANIGPLPFVEWLTFASSIALDAVLVGIPSAYGLTATPLAAKGVMARTAVLLFRLMVEFVLIVSIVQFFLATRVQDSAGKGQRSG